MSSSYSRGLLYAAVGSARVEVGIIVSPEGVRPGGGAGAVGLLAPAVLPSRLCVPMIVDEGKSDTMVDKVRQGSGCPDGLSRAQHA